MILGMKMRKPQMPLWQLLLAPIMLPILIGILLVEMCNEFDKPDNK